MDSVQRDRGRLQEECNTMERELADALEQIERLQSVIAESNKTQMSPGRSQDSLNSALFVASPNLPTSSHNTHIAVGDTEGEFVIPSNEPGGVEPTAPNGITTISSINDQEVDDISSELAGNGGNMLEASDRYQSKPHVAEGDALLITIPPRTVPSEDSPSKFSHKSASPGRNAISDNDTIGRSKSVDSAATTPCIRASLPSPSVGGRSQRLSISNHGEDREVTSPTMDGSYNGRVSRSGTFSGGDALSSPSPTAAVRDLRLELASVTADVSQ